MPKVALSSDEHAWRVTLDAPPLHILDLELLAELREVLGRITSDRHALVVDATGDRAFSAGVSVPDHLGDLAPEMLQRFHDCIRTIAALDLVTVAVVRGLALGGGCELAFACDFVLAAPQATFGFPEIRLGVFPPVAATMLAQQTAPRKALELILTGERFDAQTALELGLVNAIVDDPAPWLQRLFEQSASTLRLAKKAFRLAQLPAVERVYLEELMRTRDAEEGLRAFIEKRAPRWTHR
ncbi:MAG TPA: enoyl-CoA hydratase/isomerase family protein [Thermoanaerobaculia bacterium]|jgi:cyclohexa-1,5-dienecarbonyl-CoA hydratase